MNEYLIVYRAIIPTFFSSKTVEESLVVGAKSAKEAVEKARNEMKKEMMKHGISEYDLKENGIALTIVDVKKI